MMTGEKKTEKSVQVVRKPFETGSPTDENTVRDSLKFFGTLIMVYLVSFIACSAAVSNLFLRLIINIAVIGVVLMIFYNSGAGKGAEAVSRGEIIWQKKESGREFSASEKKVCYHPLKGYLTGLIGTIPFLILAVILALKTTIQMTDSGTLPSWMQAYTRRSDIGSALINYTQPEGMTFIDAIRALIRICILPFVNTIGYGNKSAMLLLERISPILLLLPAAAYGTGYLTGKKIRTRIHTAISENNRKRSRRTRKSKANANGTSRRREPEQLN